MHGVELDRHGLIHDRRIDLRFHIRLHVLTLKKKTCMPIQCKYSVNHLSRIRLLRSG